jgi:DNA-binding MarR family transcriptional regulator
VSESLLDSTTYRAIRVFGAQKVRFAAVLNQHGLHVGQEFMLAQLWREDGLTQSQLADRLGVSAPAVTKVARTLERGGFVRREPDDSDARVMRVRLTERGRAMEEPLTAAWYAVEADLMADLTPGQREGLLRLATDVPPSWL